MARLPQPGGDEGQWGHLLNTFLQQSHKNDGSLKDGVVTSNTLATNAVTAGVLGATGGVDGEVLVKDSTKTSGIAWKTPSAGGGPLPDATTTTKGVVQLTGDIAGSATNVSVVRINGVSVSGTPTSGQVLTASGGTAASWSAAPSAPVASVAGKTGAVTLVKSDVGLANVDNTSDVNKPVSSATQTALNAKANTVHTHAIADTTELQTALDGKVNTSALASVATSGNYTDLTGRPVIPTALGSLSDVSTTGAANGQVLKYNNGTWSPAADDVSGGTGGANLTTTTSPTSVTVNSDSGTDATISGATSSIAGVMTAADKTKLDGIAAGATVNTTDAQLRDRSTHTGTQAISTVTNLQTALDGKAASTHTHAIADTTGLQAALDGKASTAHTHTIANVTNLQTTLDGKVNAGDAALATKGGAEAVQTLTSTANTTLNLNNANVFDLTLGVTATTLQVSNATAGKACSFALYLRQGAGGRMVTWPAGTKWSGGAPTLSTAANAVDIVVLESIDGGSTWFGSLVGTNFI